MERISSGVAAVIQLHLVCNHGLMNVSTIIFTPTLARVAWIAAITLRLCGGNPPVLVVLELLVMMEVFSSPATTILLVTTSVHDHIDLVEI